MVSKGQYMWHVLTEILKFVVVEVIIL